MQTSETRRATFIQRLFSVAATACVAAFLLELVACRSNADQQHSTNNSQEGSTSNNNSDESQQIEAFELGLRRDTVAWAMLRGQFDAPTSGPTTTEVQPRERALREAIRRYEVAGNAYGIAEAQEALALAYLQQNRQEPLALSLSRAAESHYSELGLSTGRAEALSIEAQALYKLGDIANSIATARASLRATDDNTRRPALRGQAMMLLGNLYERQGSLDDALDTYKHARTFIPSFISDEYQRYVYATLDENIDRTQSQIDRREQFSHTTSQPQLHVQLGHSGGIKSVMFSLNGEQLLTTGDDAAVIWGVHPVVELKRFKGIAAAATFSRDAKSVFVADDYGAMREFDIATGQIVREHHSDSSLTLYQQSVFSSQSAVLVSASDTMLRRYRFDVGDTTQIPRPHIGSASSLMGLAVSPNGLDVAAGDSQGTLVLWDTATGRFLEKAAHLGRLTGIAFSPGGELLATCAVEDHTCKLWSAHDLSPCAAITLEKFNEYSRPSVSFSPKGDEILVTSGRVVQVLHVSPKQMSLEASCPAGRWPFVSTAVSSDLRHAAINESNDVVIVDLANGQTSAILNGITRPVRALSLSQNERCLMASMDWGVTAWDLSRGTESHRIAISDESVPFASNAEAGVIFLGGMRGSLVDLKTGAAIKTIPSKAFCFNPVISPDGKLVAGSYADGRIRVWKIWTSDPPMELEAGDKPALSNMFFSGDGHLLVVTISNGVRIYDLANDAKFIRQLPGSYLDVAAFSKDGRYLSLLHSEDARVIDLETWTEGRPIFGTGGAPAALTFLGNGYARLITATADARSTARAWNVGSPGEVYRLHGHTLQITSMLSLSNGKLIGTGSEDGTIRFWNSNTGRELCDLISVERGGWVVTAPDDRFDTDKLDELQGVNWVFPDDPFHALPPEIFMRDYYEPRLLARVLNPKNGKLEDEFPPIRPLASLNRVQPGVSIVQVARGRTADEALVTVEASKASGTFQRSGKDVVEKTSVYDLRLFRDGQLVGQWPAPPADATTDRSLAVVETPAQLDAWQQATQIKELKSATDGKAAKTFSVRLPHGVDIKQIKFTAYAFNEDRVKSQTASFDYAVPADLPRLVGKPKAYVITVGVNKSQSPDWWDLQFAASDAKTVDQALAGRLKDYDVNVMTLISDYPNQADGTPARDDATKAKIHQALLDVASKARPDDLVVLFVSSHGYTDQDGILSRGSFYFFPSDIGANRTGEVTKDLLQQCVSSEELSLWLRGIDAGQIVLIADTCHAAGAVEEPGFKPGPMGSRGLGQLAYDKGMRILAASQGDQVALEVGGTIHQGLLTYALVHDGLEKAGAADKDGKITLGSWLTYATTRVPTLYQEAIHGEVKGPRQEAQGNAKPVVLTASLPKTPVGNALKAKGEVVLIRQQDPATTQAVSNPHDVQTPQLFDYKRGVIDTTLTRADK